MERELSRRERQIMEILYRNGKASAAEVQAAMPDGPGYSAVRALLRILEEKGHIRHEEKGGKYIYLPTVSRTFAKRSAMRRLVDTFFEGSVEKAVVAFLSPGSSKLGEEELRRLEQLVEKTRKEKK